MRAGNLLFFLLFSLHFFAQSSISGYVNIEDSSFENKKLVLAQLIRGNIDSGKISKIIATSTINEKGYFTISKVLSKKQQLYYVYVNNSDSSSNSSIFSKSFLLANNDSIHFNLSPTPFSDYNTTSISDKEWQKLNALKAKLIIEKSKGTNYLDKIRTYSKDSLQILAVKLLSIKELNDKNLLKKDILLNTAYYIDLLSELKVSNINSSEYAFLEDKLALITKKVIEEKYAISKWVNILLGFIILGLLAFVYSLKRNKKTVDTIALSKQEINIRNLILQGKSNKEIANELFISLSTVKTHITNIYHKLNISNRNELELKFKK